MKTKFTIGFALLIFTVFFYAGCSLLQDKKEETSGGDVVEDAISVLGTWIESGSSPTKIVQFGSSQAMFHRYESGAKLIRDDTMNCVVHLDTKTLTLSKPGLVDQTVPFTLSGDQLQLTMNGQVVTFVRYTGAIPHSSWSVVNFAPGVVSNGMINGTWRSYSSGTEEIIRVSGSTVSLLMYRDTTLYYKNYTFILNVTRDSMVLTETTSGEVQTVAYSISGGVFTVRPSGDEVVSFQPYTGSTLPTTWRVTNTKWDSGSTPPSIEGQWLESGQKVVLKISGSQLTIKEYNSVDSVVTEFSSSFSFTNTNDSITYSKNGVFQKVSCFMNGSVLHLITTSGNHWTFTIYTGPVPLDSWKTKVINTTDYTGTWITTMTPQNEVVKFTSDSMSKIRYVLPDSQIVTTKFRYTLKNSKSFITLWNGSIAVDSGVISRTGEYVSISLTKSGVQNYKLYSGSVPLSNWTLKINKESFLGTWLISDGSKSVIMQFFKDTLIAVNYLPALNIYRKDTLTYVYASSNDSMWLYSKGIQTGKGTIVVGGGIMTVHKTDGTVGMYTKYSGSIPHPDWIVSKLLGTWITVGDNPDGILIFDTDSFTLYVYSASDSTISMDRSSYFTNTTMDTISLVTPDPQPLVAPYHFAHDTLVLGAVGDESRFVLYNGVIPHESWLEKSTLSTPDIEGTWIVNSGIPEEIVKIQGSSLVFYDYYSDYKIVDTVEYQYRFNSAEDSIFIHSDGSVIEVGLGVSVQGGTLTLSINNSDIQYVPYSGEIPYAGWVSYAPSIRTVHRTNSLPHLLMPKMSN